MTHSPIMLLVAPVSGHALMLRLDILSWGLCPALTAQYSFGVSPGQYLTESCSLARTALVESAVDVEAEAKEVEVELRDDADAPDVDLRDRDRLLWVRSGLMEGDVEGERLLPCVRRVGDGEADEDGDVFDLDRLPRDLLGDRFLCRP